MVGSGEDESEGGGRGSHPPRAFIARGARQTFFRMSEIPPLEAFLAPGETPVLVLQNVVFAATTTPQIYAEGAPTAYPPGEVEKLADFDHRRGRTGPQPRLPLAVTNKRILVPDYRIQRETSGKPIPAHEWIFDPEFARQAIHERRWAPSAELQSKWGATREAYRAAMLRRADARLLGQGTMGVSLFLDLAPLSARGYQLGAATIHVPLSSASHEAGIALKIARVPLNSAEWESRLESAPGWVARRQEKRLGEGCKILDVAIGLPTGGGAGAGSFLSLLKPYAGRMTPYLPELQALAASPEHASAATTTPDRSPPGQTGASAFCTGCGSPLPPGGSFCTKCGKRIG